MTIYTNRPELKGQPGYTYLDNSQDWGNQANWNTGGGNNPSSWGGADYLGGQYSVPQKPPEQEQEQMSTFDRSRTPNSLWSGKSGGTSIDFSRYAPFGGGGGGGAGEEMPRGISQQGLPLSAYNRLSAQKNVQTWKPTTPTPKAPVIPTYTAPAWDEKEVERLTQKHAAAGARKLRSEVQRAAGAYYENPIQRKLTLRDALAGYGQGLENVMAGASRQAVSEYAPQYGAAQQAGAMTYQANVNNLMQEYNNMMEAWKQQGTSTTEAGYTYGSLQDKAKQKNKGVMISSNPMSRFFRG